MRTNAELRKEAWGIVRGRWFWRIFAAGGALYIIMLVAAGILMATYEDMSIQTWADFLRAKVEAMRQGMGFAVPSRQIFWQMTGASAFQQFVACIFGSIVAFGLAGLMLKAVRNDEREWFAGSFRGFARPLELAWLMVLMNLLVFLWGLLLVIPGVVALYRYRQAWYLKSEHPDWGAAKCLAESGKMMAGHKWQAFCLDLSYAGWLALAWLVFAVATFGLGAGEGSLLMAMVGAAAGIGGFYLLAFALCYFFVGRTVFYKELAGSASLAEQ